MTRALVLAEKGRGSTLPNPMVGAVLVKNGKVVGEGYHKGPGKPHAEVEAIKKAGKLSRGATMFVTLEPCCHFGRTGPCTDSIKEHGIKKVVYAITDRNPLVNGKGARKLRQADIQVSNGLMSKEAARLNDVYFGIVVNQRPYVTLKIAQSLDGRIAAISGDSKWISCKESRKFVHSLRAEADAVLIGSGTFKKDNPHLTTRLVKGDNPYRIIVSSDLNFPKGSHLIESNRDYRTIVATVDVLPTNHADTNDGLTYWNVAVSGDNRVDLKDLLGKAWEFGIKSILVEGGAQIATSFLKEKLVDKFIVITAPMVLGKGVDSIGDLSINKISQAIIFRDAYRFQSGTDNIFVGYPKWSK
jgi:diaminohydroxyphosphoribosylaminopyrimidine deaminase/5-amino-6-(5-phosphoribosylamino)uracil reductase